MSNDGVLFYTFNSFKVTGGYFAICLIAILLALFIIILNAIVIHTMLCHRRVKTISDYFLSCMAISDLACGIIALYVTSYSLLQYQILHECLFRFGQIHGIFISATLHRQAFTIDRFIKLIFPLHYFRILNKTAVVAISVIIWIISLAIGFLPILGWRNKVPIIDGYLTCRYFGVLTEGYLVLVLTLLATSALFMVILYIIIFYVARKQAKSIAAQLGGFKTSKSYLDKHSLKLAKTICIVVGISNICWLPTFLVILLHLTGTLDNLTVFKKGQLITYSCTTVFLNSLINPIVFAMKISTVNSRFRDLLSKTREVFCCQKEKVVYPAVTAETISTIF